MKLSIVVVSWNVAPLLAGCLRSIPAGADGVAYEVVVVDNASGDGSADRVAQEFPAVRLIRNTENTGFARANNQGISASQGEYVLLLNSDTVVRPGALRGLVDFLDAHPRAGAVGPRLLQAGGTPQPYAFGGDPTPAYLLRRGLNRLLLRRPLHDWGTERIQAVAWVSAACIMVRRAVIEQAGRLDEHFFMYFEDSEWCLRIRKAGWQVFYDPEVAIEHLGGQSAAQNPGARQGYYRSLRYFYAKHYGPLARAALEVGLAPYRWIAGR